MKNVFCHQCGKTHTEREGDFAYLERKAENGAYHFLKGMKESGLINAEDHIILHMASSLAQIARGEAEIVLIDYVKGRKRFAFVEGVRTEIGKENSRAIEDDRELLLREGGADAIKG